MYHFTSSTQTGLIQKGSQRTQSNAFDSCAQIRGHLNSGTSPNTLLLGLPSGWEEIKARISSRNISDELALIPGSRLWIVSVIDEQDIQSAAWDSKSPDYEKTSSKKQVKKVLHRNARTLIDRVSEAAQSVTLPSNCASSIVSSMPVSHAYGNQLHRQVL